MFPFLKFYIHLFKYPRKERIQFLQLMGKRMKENIIPKAVTSKRSDYIPIAKDINNRHSSSHTQAHFTAYNQLVISKPKSKTVIKSVFAVDNYELPKLNRNT